MDYNPELDAVDEFIQLNDRVEIFRHLAMDELTTTVNEAIFEGLLTEFYDEFTEFCNTVKSSKHRNQIKGISCYIADGKIYFDIEYKKGAV